MDRRNSTRREPVVILVICIVVISVGAVVIGTIPVNGFLWNVDHIENISVGSSENQTIKGVKVYSENDPVKVQVGSFVDAGAKFDEDNSSYGLKNGQSANESEVYIKNSNSTEATVIVKPSALNDTSSFDIEIENINTTDVSKYNDNLKETNKEFEYVTSQAGEYDQTRFNFHQSANISIKSDFYNNRTNKIEFENIRLVDNSSNRIVVWKMSSEGNLTEVIASTQGYQESISINNDSIRGKENIGVTIQPEWVNSTETIYAADNSTATAPITVKLRQGPIYYPESSHLSNKYSDTVYLKFNTDIRHDQGQINYSYTNGSSSSIHLRNQSERVEISENELYISLNSTEGTEKTKHHIQNIAIDGIESEYGGEKLSHNTSNISRVSNYISSTTNETIAQGTKLVVLSNESEDIRLLSENTSINLSESGDKYHNKIVNTSEIPTGEYTLKSESETDESQINITKTSLSPNIPTATESTGIIINFEPSSTNRYITVSVQNETDTITTEEVIRTEQNQEEKASIEIPESGEYTLEFRDTHSGEVTKHSVQILENRSLSLIFDSPPTGNNLGTRYSMEISSSYNKSKLDLFDKSTNTTLATANLSTPTLGRTSIGFNTYALGNESLTDDLVTAGPGATVESVDTSMSDETLPPGTYRVAVRSEQGLAETADEATVTIDNRSTNGLSVYATTELARDDLGGARAVRRAIGNGTLSPTSTVAPSETVVYAANATGLTGLPAARNATPETGADLARLDGLAFGVRSNASTGATTEDDRTDGAVPANSSVHVDDEGLYLVAEGDDALATDETPADGETFTAEFRVVDERLREAASDPASDHAVSTTVAFEAPPTNEAGDDPTSDEPTGGDESGGESSGESGATGGGTGGAPTGSVPEAGSAPSGSEAGESGDGDRDGPRTEPGRNGGQLGVRPVADVRSIARDDSIGSPVPFSPAVTSTDASSAPPGDGDARSGEGGARADASSAGAGAGGDEARSANGADAGPRVTDGTEGDSDATNTGTETPSYDDAPIRTTADDVPGFGPLVTLAALLLAGRLAALRRSNL